MENFSTFTGVFHIVENGSLCSEPFKHFCCFVSKSGFEVSTIFCTLTSDSSKGFNKVDVLGEVHYVGGQVFCDVHKLGCFVSVKVGVYVRSLADCCSCGLDGVVADVCSLIVCNVVGFFDVAREVEAEGLFEVLSVVGVGSFDGS